jgi:RNA polymerase-interacting CarD/CdnL/TRCF family regulator
MIGVEFVDDLNSTFFKIESMDHKMKNLIPTKTDILIRKVATKTSFNKALDKMQKSLKVKEYESRKDRIASYQGLVRSNQVTLAIILSVIKEIHSLKDKGAVERQLMNELLETVSREYSFVFECDVEESKKMIKKKLVQLH